MRRILFFLILFGATAYGQVREGMIRNENILARVADTETITGAWTFSAGINAQGPTHTFSTSSEALSRIFVSSSITGAGELNFQDTASGQGIIRYEHDINKMELWTAAGERVSVDSNGLVGINDPSPTAQLDILSGSPSRIGLTVSTAASPTAPAQTWTLNGTQRGRFDITATESNLILTSWDSGTSIGPRYIAERNSNATTPAPGYFLAVAADAALVRLWPDNSGFWRTSESIDPTSANIASGTIVGDQTGVSGLMKGNGSVASAAVAGTDYWSPASDGAGSTLDADLLDGISSSGFATSGHNHDSAYINAAGDTMTGNLTIGSAVNILTAVNGGSDIGTDVNRFGNVYAAAFTGNSLTISSAVNAQGPTHTFSTSSEALSR
ncbi:MAG: hypothetical protein ACRD1R_10780, partial [Acidobacteriota bacterium]